MKTERIKTGDALLIIDIQNDFLPGGSLAVSGGEEVIPVINRCIAEFRRRGNPIFATRDWHPANHSSFVQQGGPWPEHCVAGTHGAEFPASLLLPETTPIFSTGADRDNPGYSGFEATDLKMQLDRAGVKRLFVAGLATDYCVLNTVLDALKLGYPVFLMKDAIRAVDVNPDDGTRAEQAMQANGAQLITQDMIL